MKKLQEFTKDYQRELNFHVKDESYERSKMSLLTSHMLLTTEVAEVAELLRELCVTAEQKMEDGIDEATAFRQAQEQVSDEMGKEISDCIAYLCKFGNFFERDMENDFYSKMDEVKKRKR